MSGEASRSTQLRRNKLRFGLLLGACAAVFLWTCALDVLPALASVPSNAIRYTYTQDSQLSSVIKPEAEYALYTWDAAGNLSSIAKKSSTKLSIIELESTKGAVGETINIWGTGFSSTPSNDTVKFHGTAATVSAASAYELAVKVPTGATTGTVTVQTTTEGPVTSSQTFTVISAVGAPTITSLSTSVVEAGATVTVSGTNFEPTAGNDVVRVNQTDAEVVSASSTSLKFKVPSVTGGGRVVVETPQGSATGPDLYIPPEGIATSKVGATEQISSGKSATIKLSTAETVGLVLFEATAGQHIAIVTSEDTIHSSRISIFSPQSVKLANSEEGISEGESNVDRLIAPTTGMYTVLVKPESTYTGSVTLSSVPAVTGVITPTAEGAKQAVSIATPYQQGAYSVVGTAGEEVSVNVSEFASFSKTVYLEWFTPEGKWMKERGFTGNGFMETVRFPTTGMYTLLVNPNGANTGSLKLTLYNATAVTGSITPTTGGESKTVTTAVPGQSANITFSGNSGEAISLVLSESTFQSGKVSVLTSEGSNIAESTFGTSGAMVGETGAFTLPKTGTYTIHISAWRNEEETGSVKLTAYKVTEVTGSISPSTSGASENVSLPTPGQKAKYTVSGAAGEEVSLKVSEFSSFSKTVYLTWFNTEGKWMKEAGFTGNGFMESAVLPTAGTYTLVVNPYGLNTGSLKITAYSAVTESITPTSGGESKVITINGPGQNAKITFSGKSSEEVSVVLSESTIKSGHVSIRNPEGSLVGEEKSFGSSGSTTLGPVLLSSTGTYTIFIKPEGEYIGSVKVTAYTGKPPGGMVVLRGGSSSAMSSAATSVAPSGGTLSIAALPAAPAVARAVGSHRGRDSKRGGGGVHRRVVISAGPGYRRSGVRGRAGGLLGVGLPRALRAWYPAGSEGWSPRAGGAGGGWSVGASASPWAGLAPLMPVVGTTTALAGQALQLNGLPLAGLHVAVADTYAGAVTDASGRFLLTGLPAGHQVLVVEGAKIAGRRYGTFEIGVQIAAHRLSTLDAPIWMTPLGRAGDRTIASPTRRETRITTPQIPGLEVRLPAGTVIRDDWGHVVRHLNITAIPVDRPPFPLPFFSEVPLYFTIQPGRAYLSKGAQIVYPNYTHMRPGARVDFWSYDPAGRGWYIYGQGTVTANGAQVVPDPGVKIWELTGAMITNSPKPPGSAPKPGGSSPGGDPVDMGTGLMVYRRADLAIPDTIPIVIERTYRQGDSNSYSFGIGTTNLYDLRLWSENNYHEAYLVLPNGGKILYKRFTSGEGYLEAEYKATETPSVFYGSILKWDPSVTGWDLTLTNGTTYVFGDNAPLQAIRNRQGQQLTLTRSEGQRGNITKITSPHGRWVSLTYDTSNRVKEIKDNSGRALKYAYNAAALLESATDPAERTTKYEYNTEGEMTSVTDPRGNKYLETAYNANSLVSKQTLANGGIYEFSYTLSGSKVESVTITEPRSNKRKVTFNAEGYPTSETTGLGSSVEQTTTFERQAATGFLLSSTDTRSRKTTYEYDNYGNVTTVTRLAGTSSAQTYKYAYESGTTEVSKVIDPLGHATTYEYNVLGELIASKDALGHTTRYEYNSDGQPTVITNPLSKKTTITYELGAPVAATDPLSRTTKQFVDAAGRVLSTTTPGGQRTAYEYNNDNQVTQTTDPAESVTSYEYDADGNLTAITDPLKHKSTYTYTKMDLLESETDALEKKTTGVYDTEGNLTELTDRRGKLDKFTYDALNRLTEAKYGVSGETAESTIKYEYDNGNRLTKTIDSANGTYTPEYDELNRLKSLTTPQGTVKYEYDEASRRTSMTVPGQEALKYTYDEANRLKELKRGSQSVSFAYNEANMPTTTTLPDGVEEQYGYDEAGELTSISYKKGATTLGELDYSYDLDGRREAVWGGYARTGLPEAFSANTKYNADNEQIERGGKKLVFDAEGNLTSDGSNESTYNARNQLVKVTGSIKASYGYSPFGQRTTRILGSTTTELLYDGPNAVQEIQSGKATANLITGFLPDKVFARTTSKATESLLADALGSTIALAGSTGSVESTYTYDPFGKTTKEGTASENATQYAGQEYDGNGLHYDRARYYSPTSARFLGQDPLGQAEGPNLYEYTGDNPVNATDPYGTNLTPPTPNPGVAGLDGSSGGTGGGGAGTGGSGVGLTGVGTAGQGFGPAPGMCHGHGHGVNGHPGGAKGGNLSSGGNWFPPSLCHERVEEQINETFEAAEEGHQTEGEEIGDDIQKGCDLSGPTILVGLRKVPGVAQVAGAFCVGYTGGRILTGEELS